MKKRNLVLLCLLISGCTMNDNSSISTNISTNNNSSVISSINNGISSSTLLDTSSSKEENSSVQTSSSLSNSSSSKVEEKVLIITPDNFNKLSEIVLDGVVENTQYPNEFTFNTNAVLKTNKLSGLKKLEMEVFSTYENLKVYESYIGSGTALKSNKVEGDNEATYTYDLNGGNELYIVNSSTTHRTHVYSIKITYTSVISGGNNNSSSPNQNSSSSSSSSSKEDSSLESTYTGTYYDNVDLTLKDNTLLMELRDLMTTTHKNKTTYDSLRSDIQKSDKSLNDSSKVLLLYSRLEYDATWQSGNTWNREHVWPQASGWFKTSGAGSDLHHIRPTDNKMNGTRGNKKFGEVSGGTEAKTNDGLGSGCYYNSNYFEPQDVAKGDVARILFYLLTRYSESDSYSITVVAESMSMLLKWHELDPVDEFEIQRNNVTYDIQGNRNPFIDHPGLADAIWG